MAFMTKAIFFLSPSPWWGGARGGGKQQEHRFAYLPFLFTPPGRRNESFGDHPPHQGEGVKQAWSAPARGCVSA
jgi:hypothetical protein